MLVPGMWRHTQGTRAMPTQERGGRQEGGDEVFEVGKPVDLWMTFFLA